MIRRQASRKGVVLLIVVSLLALFVLIGVTYVLVGSQYRREATMDSRTRLLHVDPQIQLDRAMYQLVRDTTNTNSTARRHSLLLDMYGDPLARRNVTSADFAPFHQGQVQPNQYLDISVDGGALGEDVNGRVLTFLSGPLKNYSTRIVDSTDPAVIPARLRVMVPQTERIDLSVGSLIARLNTAATAGTCQVLINGPAFRGTVPGDPNEDYDAVDHWNMALAGVIPYSGLPPMMSSPGQTPDNIWHVIPSFYRPNFSELNKASPDYKRLPVDNDGDGVADSLWVDMGFPVQADRSGRRYKPFFAVLCLDMDGRLNVNAHGSMNQMRREKGLNDITSQQVAVTPNSPFSTTSLYPKGQGYGPAEINLAGRSRGADGEWGRANFDDPTPGYPDGNGIIDDWSERFASLKGIDGFWGTDQDDNLDGDPDDVSEYLWPGSDDTDDRIILAPIEYQRLLLGTTAGIPGRYGDDDNPGLPSNNILDDPLSRFKFSQYPDNYFKNTNLLFNQYRSLADLNGELALGITHMGQPAYERPLLNTNDTRADNPYEFNLVQQQNSDQRFTVAELERVLRFYDIDSAFLPSRLTSLAPSLAPSIDPANIPASNQARLGEASRRAVTTDSYDLPVRPALPDNLDRSGASLQFWNQLSADLKAGERLDLNQTFANSNAVEKRDYIRSLYLLAMALRGQGRNIDFDGLTGFEETDGGEIPVLDNAYGLAQWAVNVVDFRDEDSIMTPFEFDLSPFNGVPVNGFDGIIGSADDAHPDRGLVWGCERPELLITETIAWHDRATEDLITAGGGQTTDDPPDNDFDQRLMPTSGFFVELYNPWDGDDNLRPNGNPTGEILNRKDTTGQSPVWRLIVVRGTSKDEAAGPRDPDDPRPPAVTGGRTKPSDIERCIYFTSPPAGVAPFVPNPGVESWYQTVIPNAVTVMPGRYAVIGSAGRKPAAGRANYVSYLGRTSAYNDGYVDDASEIYGDSNAGEQLLVTRKIRMVPGGLQLFVDNNSRPGPANANLNLRPTVVLPINNRIFPAADPATVREASLTITEPVGGYLDMNYTVVPGDNGEVWDSTKGDDGAFTPPLDRPLDERIRTNQGSGLDRGDQGLDLFQDGTIRDYAVVHLQRLANPERPYHSGLNPYRTIDSMSVDVTCFNGAATTDDPEPDRIRFHSLQRGDQGQKMLPIPPAVNLAIRNIWRHEPPTTPFLLANDDDNKLVGQPNPHHFDYTVHHSLGYLNTKYHPFYPALLPNGDPHPNKGEPSPTDDRKPFPWLTWLNRPFVSQYDLMLVPHSRSSRLLIDFTLNRQVANPYDSGAGGAVGNSINNEPSSDLDNWPFAHLINFYESEFRPPTPGLDLHKIFNYTHVPSRFLGTDRLRYPPQLPPGLASNHQHLFREPGKVNINTVFDPAVWDAILDGHEGPRFWGKGVVFPGTAGIVDSRRGFGPRGGEIISTTPGSNFFTSPFRTNGDVRTSLLRATSVPGIPRYQPLFETKPRLNINLTIVPDNARDEERNAYFYYQGIQRLGNLVTTRSNVYAIWITVGFFKVDAAGNPSGNPDGELGFETGEIKRHRAFYMLDRSIPVACEPGQNHNVDRAIVLRRYLE